MYTLYSDIIIAEKQGNIHELVQKQKSRDNILLAKMQKDNIPMFPMNQHKSEETLEFFKNISSKQNELNIIFIHRNNKNEIQYCNVITKGAIYQFNTDADALDYITNKVNCEYTVIHLKVDKPT
jgi:ribosomal protein S8E